MSKVTYHWCIILDTYVKRHGILKTFLCVKHQDKLLIWNSKKSQNFFPTKQQEHYILAPISVYPAIHHQREMNHRMTKPTKWLMHPAKTTSTQSDQSWLCALWVAKDPKLNSCRQQRMIRLGWCPGWSESFAGRTGHFVMLWLKWCQVSHVALRLDSS